MVHPFDGAAHSPYAPVAEGTRTVAKKKRQGEPSIDLRDGSTPTKHEAEALELLDVMRRDLAAIGAFLDDELKAAKRHRTSPKAVARLRLISDDLRSARRFSARKVGSGS